jgi:hypothetical protein
MVLIGEVEESTGDTLTTLSAQTIRSAYYCRAVKAAVDDELSVQMKD